MSETTLRERMIKDLKQYRKLASRIRRYLKHGDQDLLDMPTETAYYYFDTPYGKKRAKPQLRYYPSLGKSKMHKKFRKLSTWLLGLTKQKDAPTEISSMDPGKRYQMFQVGDAQVQLSWDTGEPPCHEVVVTRNVTLKWCGDGPAPVQDGDVIISKDQGAAAS